VHGVTVGDPAAVAQRFMDLDPAAGAIRLRSSFM